MRKDNTIEAFLALVQGGLWEKEVRLSSYGKIDFERLYQLSEEQSVVGLVAAGLELVSDIKPPKEEVLQFVGQTLQLEQRNVAMNQFVGVIVERMRREGIYALLVKGQGIAQCYVRPLWRASGDVDLLLSNDNYNKAKDCLKPLASRIDTENPVILHQGMLVDSWEVELHGSLRSRLWGRVNRVIDKAQDSVFYEGSVRSWMNGKTQVFLPGADEDVIFVFTHILQHFYREGIGLRQICDWCRLLWVYKDKIDRSLLESRINKAGITSEWKVFGAFAVERLGMPAEAMPFYSSHSTSKVGRLLAFIIETGNFGHNRDFSYYSNKPYLTRKAISLKRHTVDICKQFLIFPLDTIRVWCGMIREGLVEVIHGR